ncbi:MAG TPA: SUMF1/EgtB/PvdO family nonheme iron enzyme [Kofleriaceae bacterium]|nr:SUMF1/EgtB/PvdO family nonheme iron enzyme [Kofleriaceae bacterium]
MGKAVSLAWCLVGAACGRIDFDVVSTGDAPGDAPAPSCAGLAPTCGPAGTSSCCGSPLVPGGMFFRGYDVGTDGAYPDMMYPATVSDFRLDMYEVTVGRFRQFVNAGMGTQQNPPAPGVGARTLNGLADQGGWDASWNGNLTVDSAALVAAVKCYPQHQTWTDVPGANENLAMNCITWYEAMAFCAWDGGFLPTEAEWNYAAAGGSEQRAYPWSTPASSLVLDCSYANYYDNLAGRPCANPPNGGVNAVGSESPNGDGKWGQTDLLGNVYEWTLDWYATPYSNPCSDCADLTVAEYRVFRGCSYNCGGFNLRGAIRSLDAPTWRYYEQGVRCARRAP